MKVVPTSIDQREEDAACTRGKAPHCVLDFPVCFEEPGLSRGFHRDADQMGKAMRLKGRVAPDLCGFAAADLVVANAPCVQSSHDLVKRRYEDSASSLHGTPTLAEGADFVVWNRCQVAAAEAPTRDATRRRDALVDERASPADTASPMESDEGSAAGTVKETDVRLGLKLKRQAAKKKVTIAEEIQWLQEKARDGDAEGRAEESESGEESSCEDEVVSEEWDTWEAKRSRFQRSRTGKDRRQGDWPVSPSGRSAKPVSRRTMSWSAGFTGDFGPGSRQGLSSTGTPASELRELCSPQQMDAARLRVQDAARRLMEAQERLNHIQLRPPAAPSATPLNTPRLQNSSSMRGRPTFSPLVSPRDQDSSSTRGRPTSSPLVSPRAHASRSSSSSSSGGSQRAPPPPSLRPAQAQLPSSLKSRWDRILRSAWFPRDARFCQMG